MYRKGFLQNRVSCEESFDQLYMMGLNVLLFEGADAFPSQITMMKIGEMAKPSSTTQQTGKLIFCYLFHITQFRFHRSSEFI